MKYTTLGRSGAVISQAALGTMTFGSSTDGDEAKRQLASYLDHGGNFVETADIYNSGASECIIGEWLSSLEPITRSRVFLASKARFPVGVDPRDAGLSRRHLRRALESSLRRLEVDHIDLYQLHAWDPLTPIDESIDFLDDAVRAGKISYVGLSNFTGWQIATAAAQAKGRFPLVSMQPQYNLLVREVEWEILPASRHAGLGLLPWSPLGGGWLTGKYTRDLAPHGDTRLGENPDADGMEAWGRRKDLARTWDVLAALRRIAESRNVSMANVALAWLASRPGIASIILGARTADQLVHNIESFDLDLDPDEIESLDAASDPAPSDYPYGAPGIEQRTRSIA
ncbi:aldo/keto reductase [Diaminobutyricibacter sp. McL0608]|uniref:aldo/keto reductase n=1 Tax=Leifsonia sp. McL0608 TaxID=3143537 RepID=UPI0031F32478